MPVRFASRVLLVACLHGMVRPEALQATELVMQILHTFDPKLEGYNPSPLIRGRDGCLYGTLAEGRPNNWGSAHPEKGSKR